MDLNTDYSQEIHNLKNDLRRLAAVHKQKEETLSDSDLLLSEIKVIKKQMLDISKQIGKKILMLAEYRWFITNEELRAGSEFRYNGEERCLF